MNYLIVQPGRGLRGCASVPGDKSISHRALMLGALAEGVSRIRNFLPGGDCLATLGCLGALGIEIERHSETTLTVYGRSLRGLRPPTAPLNCVRSGTTMRLLAGILAGQPFDSVLTGDPQLARRPMRRVVEPLRRMGAEISDTNGCAPLILHGRPLHGADLTLNVASAQVKSALLLAALYADSPTTIHEPGPSRDHTERMLKSQIANGESANGESQMADNNSQFATRNLLTTQPPNHPTLWQAQGNIIQPALAVDGLTVTLNPARIGHLEPLDLTIPGDFSSAAFLLAAAILTPDSHIVVQGVNINPTRTGLLDVLRQMGAEIAVENERAQGGEPVADLTVQYAPLKSTTIQGHTVVRMIDEFPILAVAATQAQGQTIVRDAGELRVKETDRIATVVEELRKLGADIEPTPDGLVVRGPTPLRGTAVGSHGDHRLAMSLAVAGLIAGGETVIDHADCIADSFPGFQETLRNLVIVQ